MKKIIITRIAIAVGVALCAVVWPHSADEGKVPAEPMKSAVTAEIEASSKKMPPILLSDDTSAPEQKVITENKPAKTELITEEKTEPTPSTKPVSVKAPMPSATHKPAKVPAQPSFEPKPVTITLINGARFMWIPGFGWVKDEGGEIVAISVDGQGDINKQVGVMGGGSTVGNPGDELTGHKVGSMGSDDSPPTNSEPAPGTKKYIDGTLHVWVPGFGWIEYSDKPNVGIVAEDMYENGNKIGSMAGEEPQDNTSSLPTEQPTSNDDEIHIVFVETPEKNSTPPPYKPDTTSP